MKTIKTHLRRVAVITILGAAAAGIAGCASDGGEVHGSYTYTYGYGVIDPYFYSDPWYHDDVIIVVPPVNRGPDAPPVPRLPAPRSPRRP